MAHESTDTGKIYVLCIGYPKISAIGRERITFIQEADSHTNILEYQIVLIKDLSLLYNAPQIFEQIRDHSGIISFGLWPAWKFRHESGIYYGFPNSQENEKYELVKNYTLFLRDYLDITESEGNNISYNSEHWTGKIFKKFDRNLDYGAYFELKPVIELTDQMSRISQASIGKRKEKSPSIFEGFAFVPGNHKPLGAILRLGNHTLVVHPVIKHETDNSVLGNIAESLNKGILNNILSEGILQLEQEAPWKDRAFPAYSDKMKELAIQYNVLQEKRSILVGLTWFTGKELETAVGKAFESMGYKVNEVGDEAGQRDLIVEIDESNLFIVEVKGLNGCADIEDVSKFLASNPKKKLAFVVNNYRKIEPTIRRKSPEKYLAFTPAAIGTIQTQLKDGSLDEILLLSTLDIINILESDRKETDALEDMKHFSEKRLEEE